MTMAFKTTTLPQCLIQEIQLMVFYVCLLEMANLGPGLENTTLDLMKCLVNAHDTYTRNQHRKPVPQNWYHKLAQK